MRVRVPFGREVLTGYIIRLRPQPPDTSASSSPLKEVLARLDDIPTLSPELLALSEWLAERYVAAPGQCLRLVFPGKAEALKRRALRRATEKTPLQSNILHDVADIPPGLSHIRTQVLHSIEQHRPMTVLLPGSLRDLIRLYRDTVRTAIGRQQSVLILVPETDEVEPLRRLLSEECEIFCEGYHGTLSLGERRRIWARIQQGQVRAVVGTRSATFLPLHSLGLIIIDHEDHPSYKAENAPRYDTRVVAAERARRQNAVFILASAHPSLDSVYMTGHIATLPFVSQSRSLPPVRVVNLRDSSGDILSAPLRDAISERVATGQNVLLYINRKGYASVLLCRDCGAAVRCPSCRLGWSFHKQESILACRHCGRREQPPGACPACRGIHLFPLGFGTEAVEETVRRLFPTARVARLERYGRRSQHNDAAILKAFAARELDILVGTQLLTTITPRPRASLVGIVSPDAALHRPDFAAAERTYHTLREVIGLVDQDAADAAIILQTYMPEHHVIRALAAHSPQVFYLSELSARAALGYPPFGRLIALRISGIREDGVAGAAQRWASLLRKELTAVRPNDGTATIAGFELLGPIPAVPLRLRGRFRWQLVVKGTDGALIRQAVRTTFDAMQAEGHAGNLKYDVDVDPQSLLS